MFYCNLYFVSIKVFSKEQYKSYRNFEVHNLLKQIVYVI